MEHIPDHPDIQAAERTGYPRSAGRRMRVPVTDIPEIGKCQFNFGVICSSHSACDSCGWNPEVSASRKRDRHDPGEREGAVGECRNADAAGYIGRAQGIGAGAAER